MNDTEHLAKLVAELVDGWYERVEYMTKITVHTRVCKARIASKTQAELRHYTCPCPVHLEARTVSARQPALLRQLQGEVSGFTPVSHGERWGQPGSRPPGTLDLIDLVYTIDVYLVGQQAYGRGRPQRLRSLVSSASERGEEWTRETCRDLRRFIKTARIMLNYDVPKRPLRDTVCGECGGSLVVDADANSDVRCVGVNFTGSCGMTYPRWQWVDLLTEE